MNSSQNQASPTAVSAKSATTVSAVSGATPGVSAMFKSDFDYQLVRGIMARGYTDIASLMKSISSNPAPAKPARSAVSRGSD